MTLRRCAEIEIGVPAAMYRRKLTQDVTVYNPARTYDGYTLFAPTFEKVAWLIDMQGRVCHRWQMDTAPASHGVLLPNGHLMWQGKGPNSIQDFVGSGSELVEVDWDGNKVWRYEEVGLNHDFIVLDNGNLIVNVFVPMPDDVSAKVRGGLTSISTPRPMSCVRCARGTCGGSLTRSTACPTGTSCSRSAC